MKLTCPSCGAIASLDAWDNDARWRELLQVSSSLPAPLPPAVLGYFSLFRPAKSALTVKKALRLAGEIKKMVAAGHVQVQGKVARPATPAHWATGMEQMVERRESLSLPLKNHNYLRQVVWQIADDADRARETAVRNNELTGNRQVRDPRPEGGMSELMKKYLKQQKAEENKKNAEQS
ncbi:MAG TPA: hypothetical protein ENJ30_02030 [Desulfobulbaceae bacterium]|nr:hypothetical protein [Desulfobulbaceae bacterium]